MVCLGDWLGPVTVRGWLGPAQLHGPGWAQPKNKKFFEKFFSKSVIFHKYFTVF
jgi:hypothetical protein